MSAKSIVLSGVEGASAFPPERVYFAFLDGRLGHDCVECGAQCCRGHGYRCAGDDEVLHQITMRPSIRYFLDEGDDAGGSLVRNLKPGCFFLTPGNRCSIHENEGFEAKPETCRLFPFNNLRRVGEYLVVSPHPTLCPLSISPPGSRSPESDHSQLFDNMSRKPLASTVPTSRVEGADPAVMIAIERDVSLLADAWSASSDPNVAFLDFLAFVDAQASLARKSSRSNPWPQIDARQSLDLMLHALGLEYDRFQALASPDVAAAVVAVTPFLRAEYVFRSHTRGGGRYTSERVTNVVLAVYVLSQLAVDSGLPRVSVRTLTSLAASHAAVIWILAHLDCVLVCGTGTSLLRSPPPNPEYLEVLLPVLRALLPRRQRGGPQSLGEVLAQYLPDDERRRVQFLRATARQVNGKLVPLERTARNLRPRVVVERAILDIMPYDVTQAAVVRMLGKS